MQLTPLMCLIIYVCGMLLAIYMIWRLTFGDTSEEVEHRHIPILPKSLRGSYQVVEVNEMTPVWAQNEAPPVYSTTDNALPTYNDLYGTSV